MASRCGNDNTLTVKQDTLDPKVRAERKKGRVGGWASEAERRNNKESEKKGRESQIFSGCKKIKVKME